MRRSASILALPFITLALAGCGPETTATGTPGTSATTAAGESGGGTASVATAAAAGAVATAAATAARPPDIESKDILAREPVAPTGEVKHILIAWAELEPAFRGAMDPRARARTKEQADALAWDLYNELKAGKPIDPLMATYSEDPGSARTGRSYPYAPEAALVPPFKNLSMRLNVGEVGIVQTQYGWHIIVRTK